MDTEVPPQIGFADHSSSSPDTQNPLGYSRIPLRAVTLIASPQAIGHNQLCHFRGLFPAELLEDRLGNWIQKRSFQFGGGDTEAKPELQELVLDCVESDLAERQVDFVPQRSRLDLSRSQEPAGPELEHCFPI
jgi:hypothetical protein